MVCPPAGAHPYSSLVPGLVAKSSVRSTPAGEAIPFRRMLFAHASAASLD